MSFGAVVWAHGLSDVRPVFKVEMTALMGSDFGAVAKAVLMSAWESGVPVTMETLGWAERASGLRTSAVTVWLRERASEMTREPVRPLAPSSRTRIISDQAVDDAVGRSDYMDEFGVIFANCSHGGFRR